MKGLSVTVMLLGLAAVGCTWETAAPGAQTADPTRVAADEPASLPTPMALLGAGGHPDLESVGEFLFPMPPVTSIPGVAPRLAAFHPATVEGPPNLLNAWETWQYQDQNDPAYTRWRWIGVLTALAQDGWECNEDFGDVTLSWDQPDSTVVDVTLMLSCTRPRDGAQLFWDIFYYFEEPQEVVRDDSLRNWQEIGLCLANGPCLSLSAIGRASRIFYEIRANVVEFREGAPIPPVDIPMKHLGFLNYEYQALMREWENALPNRLRWRFSDLGDWIDSERWATIKYLMREGGFTEGCRELTQDYDPESEAKAKAGLQLVTWKEFTCSKREERLYWGVFYYWDREVSQDWDSADAWVHRIILDVSAEPSQ